MVAGPPAAPPLNERGELELDMPVICQGINLVERIQELEARLAQLEARGG
jgi:hypothetical protein